MFLGLVGLHAVLQTVSNQFNYMLRVHNTDHVKFIKLCAVNSLLHKAVKDLGAVIDDMRDQGAK